jgi:TolB-like protein/tetratricopeptide (TPR) repeat protein
MNETRIRRGTAETRRAAMLSRVGVAGAVSVVAVLVFLGIRNALPSLPSTPTASDRVVVLPFDNRTGDPSLDALGLVVADRITTGLQLAGQAVVPSVDAVRSALLLGGGEAARDDAAHAAAVAAETGARIVVSGEIDRSEGSLRFRTRLIDPRGVLDLDAPEDIVAPPAAPMSGVEALREDVVRALAVRDAPDTGQSVAVPAPPATAAYLAFAEGLRHEARNEWRAALDRFTASHAADSTATASLVHAALCHLRLDEFAAADSLARIAEPDSARLTEWQRAWLRYAAAYSRGNMDDALRATGRAWELAPHSFASWDLARTALRTNRPRIAWSTLLNLDPELGAMRGWFPYWTVMTESLHRMGEHERELVASRRAGELHPAERRTAHLEAAALAALGRRDELERVLDDAVRMRGHEIETGHLLRESAAELRAHGQIEAADSMMRRALAWSDAAPETLRPSAEHLRLRALILEELGSIEEAARIVADPASGGTDWMRTGWLGRLAAQQGDTARAMAAARSLADRNDPYTLGEPLVEHARILAVLGVADGALALLREARTRGWALPRHPAVVFSALAAEPAFARLIQPPD